MNCIIIDDEPLARQELEALINEVSNLEILAKFSSALKALEFLNENKVDLIFLDIEMPHLNGLEFAKKMTSETMIIFTTAYAQYALKSYDLNALDYLLKPIDPDRLLKAINRANEHFELLYPNKETIEENSDEFLFVKADRRFYRVLFNDILFIEGLKDYVIIHATNQKLITALNLKTISKKLPLSSFIRVSKSYIVNHNQISSFDSHTIYINENEIPLGEVYKKDFYKNYLNGTLNF